MSLSVVVVASFLLAFKAILLEGSEVAILSIATVGRLGRENVAFGVLLGGASAFLLFLGVRQAFLLLPETLVDFATGFVLLYFSYRFLRASRRYIFGRRSFAEKMKRMEDETVERGLKRYASERPVVIPFSPLSALPVFTITLTEGLEASLVLAAAGTYDLFWTTVGTLTSLAFLVAVSALSYEYLLMVPRWSLDLLAGTILLVFGGFFLMSGLLGLP